MKTRTSAHATQQLVEIYWDAGWESAPVAVPIGRHKVGVDHGQRQDDGDEGVKVEVERLTDDPTHQHDERQDKNGDLPDQ